MSYQVADKVNGVIGGVFKTEAEAKAVIDEIVAEGAENEANWLLELAHAKEEGGSVNMEDEEFVQRILAAPKDRRRDVAMECAKERIYASYKIVESLEE